jgi:hypothetical protein
MEGSKKEKIETAIRTKKVEGEEIEREREREREQH